MPTSPEELWTNVCWVLSLLKCEGQLGQLGDQPIQKPCLKNPDLISHLSVSERCDIQVWIFFRPSLVPHVLDEDTLGQSYFEGQILGSACRPHQKIFGKSLSGPQSFKVREIVGIVGRPTHSKTLFEKSRLDFAPLCIREVRYPGLDFLQALSCATCT